ncbi:MAG: hypothetical protein H6620_10830 [Halobacteriovoraceae bacterium]|nr:hypothetical protein [Halobacteriovoraceae bacterium]
MKRLQKNMQEALNLYIQEPEDSIDLAPLRKKRVKKTPSIYEVSVSTEIAFPFMVRYHRIQRKKSFKI